jgi:hypothetical protein
MELNIGKGFSPFSLPHMKTNGYCHHQRQFSNPSGIVITNPIHTNLVQHASTITTHLTTIVAQNKAQSYTK